MYSNMNDEVFICVEDPAWMLKLAASIKPYFPYSVSMYNCLLLHSRGHSSVHDFYILRDSSASTIIISTTKGNQETAVVFCCEHEADQLISALQRTKLLDWQKPLHLLHAPPYLHDGVTSFLQEKTQCSVDIMVLDTFVCEQAEDEIREPKGMRVRHLGETAIHQMHQAWLHNKYMNVMEFLSLSKHKLNVGVYEDPKVEDCQNVDIGNLPFADDDEEAVAWITLNPYGASALLHTREQYRRRGLARLVVQSHARLQALQDLVPHVFVEEYNNSSRNLFTMLPGWKFSHKTSTFGIHRSL